MEQLREKILAEIRNQGAISFARFMELALYCPVYGYYEKEEDTPGRAGDYYTSVSVGSLFGELLGLQFSVWLTQMAGQENGTGPRRFGATADDTGFSKRFQIVEAGAHTGALTGDILSWFQTERPDLSDGVEYWIVEPSDRRQEWQRRTLRRFLPRVRWARSFSDLSSSIQDPESREQRRGIRGIIFSNELLDAMPVHRLGWDKKRSAWFEWGVTAREDKFEWTQLTPVQSQRSCSANASSPEGESQAPCALVANRWPKELLETLPGGFVLEVCPEAARWWSQAAAILERGKLMTVDYGLSEEEVLTPERVGGTLRAYYRHRLNPDLLVDPGNQDLTAHIDFSMLRSVGEAAGLKTEDLVTQEQFLTRIASRVLATEASFGAWTPERTRQFRTLTHPQHLGKAFRVLVQSR